jgi:hypothetical protein
MPFEPQGKTMNPTIWNPSPALQSLALRRCSWINCDELADIQPPEVWFSAVIVGCYYQGLADGVKHMAKKVRDRQTPAAGGSNG